MKLLFSILCLFCLTLIVSCGEKSTPLETSIISQNDKNAKNPFCLKADLTKNILIQDNLLSIFNCLGWNTEYSNLYLFIETIESSTFNEIFAPINDTFFKDLSTTNKAINFIQNKISTEQIKVTSEFIVDLISSDEVVQFLKEFIGNDKFQKLKPDFFKIYIEKSNLSEISIVNESTDIRKLIAEAKANQDFQKVYRGFQNSVKEIILGDPIVLSILSNYLEKDLGIINAIGAMSSKSFIEILRFNHENESLVDDVAFVSNAISNNLYNCFDQNDYFFIDHKKELLFQLNKLAFGSKNEFYVDLIELTGKFSLFNNICPYQDFNLVASRVLSYLRHFILIDGGYESLKSLAKLSKSEKNEMMIFNIMEDSKFQSLTKFILDIDSQENSESPVWMILKKLNEKELKIISSIIDAYLKDEGLKQNISYAIGKFNSIESTSLFSFLIEEIVLNKDLGHILKSMNLIHEEYPSSIDDIVENINSNSKKYSVFLDEFARHSKDEPFRDDLKSFIGPDTLLKLIELIKNNSEKPESPTHFRDVVGTVRVSSLGVKAPDEILLINCIEQFNTVFDDTYDFWVTLNKYPKECVQLINSRELASYIFEWTLEIDKLFESLFQKKFSIQYGVISPGMMVFYHKLMHTINKHLVFEKDYIKKVVANIQDELFKRGLVDVIDSGLVLIENINQKTDFLENIFSEASNLDELEFNKTINASLSLLAQSPTAVLKNKPYDCVVLDQITKGQNCLSFKKAEAFFESVTNLLQRDNGVDKKLYNSLVDFLFGKGIQVPFDSSRSKNQKFNLEEFVRFVIDITDPSTKKTITFQNELETLNYSALLAERLEIVIREISFLNNFYGAYFMNQVSKAKNYKKKVLAMKKNVTLMEKTSTFFINRGIFPAETKWAFKNIIETYDSLHEIDNVFIDAEFKTHRYGSLIQTFLAMVVETSSFDSQRYSPFQTPKVDKVKSHNGLFITKMTEVSFLTHIGSWLRNRYDGNLQKLFLDKKFQYISDHFSELMTTDQGNRLFKVILEYLSIEDNRRYLLDIIYKLNPDDTEKLINLFFEGSYVFLENVPASLKEKCLEIVELIFTQKSEIKLSQIEIVDLIHISNDLISRLAKMTDQQRNQIFSFSTDIILNIQSSKIADIFTDRIIINDLTKFINNLIQYQKASMHHSGVFSEILSDQSINFNELRSLLIDLKNNDKNYEYLINIIQLLITENDKRSNAYNALSILFLDKTKEIELFLIDIFDRFSINESSLNN